MAMMAADEAVTSLREPDGSGEGDSALRRAGTPVTQVTTPIDGVTIHFAHQRSKQPNAIPMLLLNGWPSSFAEYSKVIMPLVNPAASGAPADQAFYVVIPAMPGFGFSGKRTAYGYTPDRIARLWTTLMARLGYDRGT
jgi:pimeloyl-ACP methyl ester carboxylesterase